MSFSSEDLSSTKITFAAKKGDIKKSGQCEDSVNSMHYKRLQVEELLLISTHPAPPRNSKPGVIMEGKVPESRKGRCERDLVFLLTG